jgi:superfamily I DNA/RNA helicase
VLVKLPSFRAEVDHLAKRLMAAHNKGRPWSEMAVLYRSKFMGEELAKGLRAAGLPVDWLQEDGTKRRYDPAAENVKLLTMHSSKGLEFPLVAIPGLGYMPRSDDDAAEEARVLYVAMTRAMDELVMTCSRPSTFVQRLDAVGLAVAA